MAAIHTSNSLLLIHKRFTFQLQSPKWLGNVLRRLDHLAAAVSPEITLYAFDSHINVSVNTDSDQLHLIGEINGHRVHVPNVPFWLNRKIDAKFGTIEQFKVNAGIVRKYTRHPFDNFDDAGINDVNNRIESFIYQAPAT